jgi:hypothetical protein
VEEFYEDESLVAYRNLLDQKGACSVLKEMIIWSTRLSESIDELHNFIHTREGNAAEMIIKILTAKNALATMWAVPTPVETDNDLFTLTSQSPSTTLN